MRKTLARRRRHLGLESLESRDLMAAVVAVLDQGIDLNNPQTLPYFDFTWAYNSSNGQSGMQSAAMSAGNPHGQLVAESVINGFQAARNAYGTNAPELKIMPIRITDSGGNGSAHSLITAIFYAADHGANVINLSMLAAGLPKGVYDNNGRTITEAVKYAEGKGAIIVTGAGNDGNGTSAASYGPANTDISYTSINAYFPAPTNVLVATAVVPSTGNLSPQANWHPVYVDLGVPESSGATSYAAGYASGVAGFLSALLPPGSPQDSIQILLGTVTPHTQSVGAWSTSGGNINVAAAVNEARNHVSLTDMQTITSSSGDRYLFALGANYTLYYSVQTQGSNQFLSWTTVSGSTGTASFKASIVNGAPYIFIRSLNSKVYTRKLINPSTGTWNSWTEVGGATGTNQISPLIWSNIPYLFIISANGKAYYNIMAVDSGTNWREVPSSLGVTNVAPVLETGYVHLFTIINNAVYNSYLTDASTNTWSTTTKINNSDGIKAVSVLPSTSASHVFMLSYNTNVYFTTTSQAVPAGSSLSAVANTSGTLSLTSVRGTDDSFMVHTINSSGWIRENAFRETAGPNIIQWYLPQSNVPGVIFDGGLVPLTSSASDYTGYNVRYNDSTGYQNSGIMLSKGGFIYQILYTKWGNVNNKLRRLPVVY